MRALPKFLIGCTFFLFLSCAGLLYGQNKSISKLDLEFRSSPSDTLKITILNNIGVQILESDPEKALKKFTEALSLAKKINNKEKIAYSYSYIGLANRRLNDYPKSFEAHKIAIKIAEELKIKRLLAFCYGNISKSYRDQNEKIPCFDFALRSLKLYEGLKDVSGIANMRSNIGTAHFNQTDLKQALENFEIALKLYQSINDSLNLALIYDNLTSVNTESGKQEEALKYAQTALRIRELIKDTIGLSHSYFSLGNLLIPRGDFKKAIKYYEDAIEICKRSNNKRLLSHIYIITANAYYHMNDFKNAEKYIDLGLPIAREIRAHQTLVFAFYLYTMLSEKQKDFKSAYDTYKVQMAYMDSLNSTAKAKQITEMQTKYETEKKEKEIEFLRQNTEILTQKNQIQELDIRQKWYFIIGLIATLTLISLIAILVINQNKLKASQTKMDIEQRLFRSQMNPHFIFNSLIAIQNYVYKHEPADVANYISNFAKLMRMILENSRKESITIEKEIALINYYLELQQLRFPDKFDFSIDIDPEVDIESILIPPMLSQPIIENAIEHGIMNKKDGKGKIEITFTQKDKFIQLSIKDNGIGRENSGNINIAKELKHQSLATTITEERLSLLNKKNKEKFSIKIVDLKNSDGSPAGTEVILMMPEL
jgi:tetratricopeptide (TPR) repeat protein